MSTGPQGHGWWQSSDLKWYPPEDHPNYVAPPPRAPETYTPVTPSAQYGGQRRLSEAERNQILDAAITSRVRGSGTLVSRSATSAQITWRAEVTDPRYIMLCTILSVCSCGLFILYWFPITLRRPGVSTVFVDEYGNQRWDQKEISPAQRVLSVIVFIPILIVIIVFIAALVSPSP
jgi:hypothetical protein